MYCHECGQLLEEDVNFCLKCGTNLKDRKTKLAPQPTVSSNKKKPNKSLLKIGLAVLSVVILGVGGYFLIPKVALPSLTVAPAKEIAGNYRYKDFLLDPDAPIDILAEISDDGVVTVKNEKINNRGFDYEVAVTGVLEETEEDIYTLVEEDKSLTFTITGPSQSELEYLLTDWLDADVRWYYRDNLVDFLRTSAQEEDLPGSVESWIEIAERLTDNISITDATFTITLNMEDVELLKSRLYSMYKNDEYEYLFFEFTTAIAMAENELASFRLAPTQNGIKFKTGILEHDIFLSRED